MRWFIVIGTVPGDLRSEKTKTVRWSATSHGDAASTFFRNHTEYRRCLVCIIDASIPGPQKTYVFDRVDDYPMVKVVR